MPPPFRKVKDTIYGALAAGKKHKILPDPGLLARAGIYMGTGIDIKNPKNTAPQQGRIRLTKTGLRPEVTSATRISERGREIGGLAHGSSSPPFTTWAPKTSRHRESMLGHSPTTGHLTNEIPYARQFRPFVWDRGHYQLGRVRTHRPLNLTDRLSDSDARRLAWEAAKRHTYKITKKSPADLRPGLQRETLRQQYPRYRERVKSADDIAGGEFGVRKVTLGAALGIKNFPLTARHAGFDSLVGRNDDITRTDRRGHQILPYSRAQLRTRPSTKEIENKPHSKRFQDLEEAVKEARKKALTPKRHKSSQRRHDKGR